MEITFRKNNEGHYRNLENTLNTKRVLYSKLKVSILSNEVFQDEKEEKYSTRSIQIEESLLRVTPSPAAPKVYEISGISSSHIVDPEEAIQISVIE